jgi:hypothetical protein
MEQTTSQQQPTCKRQAAHPTRYIARVEDPEGIRDLAMGTDESKMVRLADRHHTINGYKTWVWNVRDGRTVWQAERGSSAGGGR